MVSIGDQSRVSYCRVLFRGVRLGRPRVVFGVCAFVKLRHVCDDACGALSAAAASAGSLRAARGSGGAALCGTAHTPHRPRGRPAATARVGPQRPHRGGRGRAGPPGGLAHGPWRVRWAGMARLGLRGLADACRVLTGARYIYSPPCGKLAPLRGPDNLIRTPVDATRVELCVFWRRVF